MIYNRILKMKLYQLPLIKIDKEWENVTEFCDWYIENNLPMNIPKNYEIFLSDDATAVTLFRHSNFQVEMYLIHPYPKVPIHEHPGVEVIKVRLYYEEDHIRAEASDVLRNGQSHGVGMRLEREDKGFVLLAVQHWKDQKPSTVAATWKGKTVGPLQENLIRRFHPESLILDGYADISKTKEQYYEEFRSSN